MQYVGKFVSSVYNTITPNINPATLSGAIDVIVVERWVDMQEEVEVDSNGTQLSDLEKGKLPEAERKYITVTKQVSELASTPFHVRFGKMSVLRPAERKVTLHLNDSADPLPFAMKVGESGEAFFVLEIDDEEERNSLPADLVTSPILSAAASPVAMPEFSQESEETSKAADVEPLDLGDSYTTSEQTQTEGQDDHTQNDADLDADLTLNARSVARTLPHSATFVAGSSGDGASDFDSSTDEKADKALSAALAQARLGPKRPASADIERSNSDSRLLDRNPQTAEHSEDDAEVKSIDISVPSPSSPSTPKPKTPGGRTYAKTLRLSSDQLKSLNLRKGANNVTFSVTSSYSGLAICTARIFLWESSHKIVVSDIDGTITKSDALGHVFTMIGRDWTHLGVAKLYTDIARNGYRIMYLTSRAIGQADSTRDYLKGIRQNAFQLPDGPVIMSPDRLMTSLHREVILRKPEVFKMAVLRDIARLFGADPRTAPSQPGAQPKGTIDRATEKDENGVTLEVSNEAAVTADEITPPVETFTKPSTDNVTTVPLTPLHSGQSSASLTSIKEHRPLENPTPFYAGFGNRITDALSYRSVNIPSSRIFTIDTYGEVKMELLELAGHKSSYIHMTDLVDQMFPPITAREAKAPRKPEFNDFNYWRPAIMDVELPPDDELLGTPPVSPALSARSGRSLRSVRSITSDSGMVTSPLNGNSGGGGSGGGGGAEEKPGRLSRFGLGSLGLSRKSSVSSKAEPADSGGLDFVAPSKTESDGHGGERRYHQRATSAEPMLMTQEDEEAEAGPTLSSSASTSSWRAPWRRRAASPDDTRSRSQRATSPLMGPVLTAEPESEDEGQEFHDSEGDDDDNDDVPSFGGNGRSMPPRTRLASFGNDEDDKQFGLLPPPRTQRDWDSEDGRDDDNDEEEGDTTRTNKPSAKARPTPNDESDQDDDGDDDDDDNTPEDLDVNNDPLLETGEIWFEWKG